MSIDLINTTELFKLDLQPQRAVIEDMAVVGLNILAGNPKSGKSWLILQIAHAIATGSEFLGKSVIQGKVLYLGLEDTRYRIRNRMRILRLAPTDNLVVATKAPTLSGGTLEFLLGFLSENPEFQMVIIDTLGRVRDSGGNGNVYQEDTQLGGALQELGFVTDTAVVVVHHMRKQGHSDFLRALSGSVGLPGAADIVLGLDRERGKNEAFLHRTGRDVEDGLARLWWNSTLGGWQLA